VEYTPHPALKGLNYSNKLFLRNKKWD